MASFYQDPPRLGNQYDDDRALRDHLRRVLPAEVFGEIEPDLRRFGDRVVTDIAQLAADAEQHPPRLVSFDPWGRRIDHIETARGWQELDRVSAEEGLVAIGYERRQAHWSRVYQFAKLYLFNPSSATYTCPLAMTDGAARLIEVHGDDALRQGPYRRLTSRDPQRFWTSGQWMTERTGGSDVGRTETRALADGGGYRLYGTKWFTSATTAQIALTLARIEDADGRVVPGSRGLGLFYVEMRDAEGRLNNIEILRLKDKFGTRALPTAELQLAGSRARLVGEPGRGVRNIAALINVTRIYNTMCATSAMRRGLALARDYARRREAFGKPLAEHPLHLETLAELEVEFQGALELAFHVVGLLGKEECGVATPAEQALLRLLTPIAKLYTAKRCVAAMSEVLEAFGGAGYVEDTGLPQLLRDAQVLSIWEGTTNILSLDALRAIEKDQAFEPLVEDVAQRLAAVQMPELLDAAEKVQRALADIQAFLPRALGEGAEGVEAAARRFAYSLARTYTASLLLEHAQWLASVDGDARGLAVARRWCAQDLAPLVTADAGHRAASRALALDEPLTSLAEELEPAATAAAGKRG